MGAGAGIIFLRSVGSEISKCSRVTRSRRDAVAGRHVVRSDWQGSVYLFRLRLVPRAAGRGSGRLSHVREHAERGQSAVTELQRTVADEPPPFLGTWSRVYTVVVIYLACLVTLFY